LKTTGGWSMLSDEVSTGRATKHGRRGSGTMSTAQLRRWSRSDYDKMMEAGIFAPGERVELIDGEIVEMSPQHSAHSTAVSLSAEALCTAFGAGFDVRTRMPLALDLYSEPEPDVAVVPGSPRDYRDAHPTTALLVVEVADSTEAYDRDQKGSLYARAADVVSPLAAPQARIAVADLLP